MILRKITIIRHVDTLMLMFADPPPRRDDGWALVGDWAITTNDKQYSNSW